MDPSPPRYVAQRMPGPGIRVLPILHHRDPIDKDVSDAGRILVRSREGGGVLDRGGVEDDDVGPAALAEEAAVSEAEGGGGERGHLADGVFEAQELEVADVAGEDAGVVAVAARVRDAVVDLAHAAV